MGIYTVPDQNAIRLTQFSPEFENGTPLDLLREGDQWALDSFHAWVKDPMREEELEEFLTGHPMHARTTLESLQHEWSNRVSKGEW